MSPDFWLERWKNNQIGFHQQAINNALQDHWRELALPAPSAVFVPLCGKSRDMLWLRAQGHTVLGIEFIPMAVRDFFAENGLTPAVSRQPLFERWEADGITILCGDFFDLTAADLNGVVGVYDRASLIALPREMRGRYIDRLNAILPPAAETLLITVSYPEGEISGPPFSVTDQEVRALCVGKFEIEALAENDTLARNASLCERGLTQLLEHVYRLRKITAGV